MKKNLIDKLNELEVKTGITETGVKVVTLKEYEELKKKGKISDKIYYIIDNIGILNEK